jgi:hypothetical protein
VVLLQKRALLQSVKLLMTREQRRLLQQLWLPIREARALVNPHRPGITCRAGHEEMIEAKRPVTCSAGCLHL